MAFFPNYMILYTLFPYILFFFRPPQLSGIHQNNKRHGYLKTSLQFAKFGCFPKSSAISLPSGHG